MIFFSGILNQGNQAGTFKEKKSLSFSQFEFPACAFYICFSLLVSYNDMPVLSLAALYCPRDFIQPFICDGRKKNMLQEREVVEQGNKLGGNLNFRPSPRGLLLCGIGSIPARKHPSGEVNLAVKSHSPFCCLPNASDPQETLISMIQFSSYTLSL